MFEFYDETRRFMGKLYLLQTDQNILNVIAIKHFNYKQVVIVKDTSFQSPYAENSLRNYLEVEKFHTEIMALNPYDIQELNLLASQLCEDDLFVIPNSRYSYTLNMTQVLSNKCQLAFVEEDGDIYKQRNGLFVEITKDQVELEVEDYIKNIGGYIKHSSENLFEEACANELFHLILKDLDLYRRMLKPSPIKMDYQSGIVHIMDEYFKPEEKELMTQLINIMVHYDICSVMEKRHHNSLIFYHHEYKDFIGKVGTWLEMATYKALSSIRAINEPMSSVFFYWSRKKNAISNEIDVMGTYDKRLVLISCKDTNHNLEKALYELFTHSEQLGYDKSIKVLVTTSNVYPKLKQRGKELGIHIIQFNKSVKDLADQLRECLN